MVETARTRGVALDFRSNELSDVSMQRLSEALKPARPYVVALRLENNQDEDGTDVFRQRIEYYLKRNAGVLKRACLLDRIAQIAESSLEVSTCHIDHETLSLSDADALTVALKDNVSITDLRLQDNGLPQEATKRIVNALHNNKFITKLAIVDNNIGDSGFLALSALLRSPGSALRSLKVANSIHVNEQSGLLQISPRTASAFHYTFANFSALTTLSLSNCALDDVLIGAIVSGVARGARIESLCLPFNRISDRSVHVFAHLMHRCQLLRYLDLVGSSPALVRLSILTVGSDAPSAGQQQLHASGPAPARDGRGGSPSSALAAARPLLHLRRLIACPRVAAAAPRQRLARARRTVDGGQALALVRGRRGAQRGARPAPRGRRRGRAPRPTAQGAGPRAALPLACAGAADGTRGGGAAPLGIHWSANFNLTPAIVNIALERDRV